MHSQLTTVHNAIRKPNYPVKQIAKTLQARMLLDVREKALEINTALKWLIMELPALNSLQI